MTSLGLCQYSPIVEERNDISLALERIMLPTTQQPTQPGVDEADQALNISVVFTSVEWTVAALKNAGVLAAKLGARITLLVPQVVPYALPLESPPVLLDWNERRFRIIARESPVATSVHLYLCRDSVETLKGVLKPKSLVVIGSHKHWWPFTREKSLARKLRHAGHDVILTETE